MQSAWTFPPAMASKLLLAETPEQLFLIALKLLFEHNVCNKCHWADISLIVSAWSNKNKKALKPVSNFKDCARTGFETGLFKQCNKMV